MQYYPGPVNPGQAPRGMFLCQLGLQLTIIFIILINLLIIFYIQWLMFGL